MSPSITQYLEPHWFWNGLSILLCLGGVVIGVIWISGWLREWHSRRKKDDDS